MKIAILSFEHAVMSSVAGPFDMFNQTNDIVESFRPDIKIPKIEAIILPLDKIDNSKNYDLIIIPAFHFNYAKEVLEKFAPELNWLVEQYNKGTEIASICLGAFLLASTGLIDNNKCTTHWMGAEMFRQMFPKVQLVDDRIITDYNRIYSSGGAYSFTVLIIYLIEKYFGHEVAILISKVFLVHTQVRQQSSFKILDLQKNHHNKTIKKVQEHIETKIEENLSIEDLADFSNMNKRTFMRHFKDATGETPYNYIQKVKVEKAKKMIEMNSMGIEQIGYEVGYSDISSFRKTFKKHAGVIPSEYKKLYHKMVPTEYSGN